MSNLSISTTVGNENVVADSCSRWIGATEYQGVSVDALYIAQVASDSARASSGRIVKHLWIIFVCLPIVLGILFALLTAK